MFQTFCKDSLWNHTLHICGILDFIISYGEKIASLLNQSMYTEKGCFLALVFCKEFLRASIYFKPNYLGLMLMKVLVSLDFRGCNKKIEQIGESLWCGEKESGILIQNVRNRNSWKLKSTQNWQKHRNGHSGPNWSSRWFAVLFQIEDDCRSAGKSTGMELTPPLCYPAF